MENKISIIIPIYNVEQYLEKCLDSVVFQEKQAFEVLLIDDGSTDKSGAIAKKYEQQYENVHYYYQDNQGLGGARNTGIQKSKGNYILFIDSDDYISKDTIYHLDKQINKSNPDILIFDFCKVSNSGKITEVISENLTENLNYNPKKHKEIILVGCSACNKIFKKQLFIENNIYFPSRVWFEDFSTIPKLLLCSNKINYINKTFYYYLVRQGSIINSQNLERQIEIITAMNEICKFFKSNGLFEQYYSELEFLAILHINIYGISRLIQIQGSQRMINQFRGYVKVNFPTYKKNKYIFRLSGWEKRFYYLLRANMLFVFKLRNVIKGE